MAKLRLIMSAIIAFLFYAAWAYYANSLVSDDSSVLIKAAIVQGTYSGSITLIFTFMLELFHAKFGHTDLRIAFLVPRWSNSTRTKSETQMIVEDALEGITNACSGNCVPGMLLVPIPALLIQTILVVAINIWFATPNLWLTVAPSVIFSAIYGYSYSITLTKRQQRSKVTKL